MIVPPGTGFSELAQVTPSLLWQIPVSSASLQLSRARATHQGDAPASVSGGFRSAGHEHAAKGPLLPPLEQVAPLDVVPLDVGAMDEVTVDAGAVDEVAVDEAVAPPAPPTVSPVHAASVSTTASRDVA